MKKLSNIERIGLGTAQFGLDYGISNSLGQVPADEVARILKLASEAGIDTLDSAALYGDSEAVLGELIDDHHAFKIITKTVGVGTEAVTFKELDRIQRIVEKSLVRLKTDRLYGLIVHDVNDLFKPNSDRLIDMLNDYRQAGTVEKIGTSIYTAAQLDRLLDRFTPDLVQLPGNVLDQRLVSSGHLKKLKSLGVEIHMRSVFLQGLLLMTPAEIDPYFETIVPHLEAYHTSLKRNGVTPLQGALQFALGLEEVDRVIIGVCSCSELRGVIGAAENVVTAGVDFNRYALDDPAFLNPSNWRLTPELV